MYNCFWTKSWLVIDLEEDAHGLLMQQAQQRNMTLANYVREALQLPLGRQGVRTEPTQVVRPTIEDVDGFYLTETGPASFQVWLPAPNQTDGSSPRRRVLRRPLMPPLMRLSLTSFSTRTEPGEFATESPARCPANIAAPLQQVRIFGREQLSGVGANPITYVATTSRAPYSWIEDLRQGKPGYFLTGLPNASALWQIISCEPDPADRCTFLLSPVRLPHGLPSPDLAKITDGALRDEARLHWSNLEQAVLARPVRPRQRSSVPVRGLAARLPAQPGPSDGNLADMLKRLEKK